VNRLERATWRLRCHLDRSTSGSTRVKHRSAPWSPSKSGLSPRRDPLHFPARMRHLRGHRVGIPGHRGIPMLIRAQIPRRRRRALKRSDVYIFGATNLSAARRHGCLPKSSAAGSRAKRSRARLRGSSRIRGHKGPETCFVLVLLDEVRAGRRHLRRVSRRVRCASPARSPPDGPQRA